MMFFVGAYFVRPFCFLENTYSWEQRKLGEIYGKIRNAFVGTATPYYVDQGYFYLESNNVKNGQINRNTEVFINEAFYYAQRDKWLKENDLVMVQSGHVGHTAVIPKELDNTAAHALITFSDYQENTDPHFLNYFFQTTLAKLEIEKITTGNTIKHILSSDMKEFQINIPKYEEQTAIGNFFKQLDETIALHQRQTEKYHKLKIGFLESVFCTNLSPNNSKKTNAWEQRKLGDLVDLLQSYPLSRNAETNEQTGYKYIHYGDIHRGKLSIIKSQDILPNIQKGDFTTLQKGDVIVADVSEDYIGIANPCVIDCNINDFLVAGLHTIAVRPKEIDPIFMFYLLFTDNFKNYGHTVGTGTKVFGITAKNFLNFEYVFPTLAEQTAIGDFFKQLDETIALHQRKIEKYQFIKQLYLEKMFIK